MKRLIYNLYYSTYSNLKLLVVIILLGLVALPLITVPVHEYGHYSIGVLLGEGDLEVHLYELAPASMIEKSSTFRFLNYFGGHVDGFRLEPGSLQNILVGIAGGGSVALLGLGLMVFKRFRLISYIGYVCFLFGLVSIPFEFVYIYGVTISVILISVICFVGILFLKKYIVKLSEP